MIAHLAVGADDVGDAEVDVGREPPVQLDLAVADPLTRRAGAEVQEREVDRLLQLVGAVAEEHHPRRVGLGHMGRFER